MNLSATYWHPTWLLISLLCTFKGSDSIYRTLFDWVAAVLDWVAFIHFSTASDTGTTTTMLTMMTMPTMTTMPTSTPTRLSSMCFYCKGHIMYIGFPVSCQCLIFIWIAIVAWFILVDDSVAWYNFLYFLIIQLMTLSQPQQCPHRQAQRQLCQQVCALCRFFCKKCVPCIFLADVSPCT